MCGIADAKLHVWSGHSCPLPLTLLFAFDFDREGHDVQSCHMSLNEDAGFRDCVRTGP
jgi:hypothetical protein